MKKITFFGFFLVVLLLLAITSFYWTMHLYFNTNQLTGKSVLEQGEHKIQLSIADDSPVKGSNDAPVTIIEFSDFQCPYCGNFFTQVFPLIEEKYVKTGKVKFIYLNFPLSFHKYSRKAAEAAACANQQGKFWEYHDILFTHQQALDEADLKAYAKGLGLEIAQFDTCLDSEAMTARITKEFNDGLNAGVSGTPSFFINGAFIKGLQPYETFEQVIKQELKRNESVG